MIRDRFQYTLFALNIGFRGSFPAVPCWAVCEMFELPTTLFSIRGCTVAACQAPLGADVRWNTYLGLIRVQAGHPHHLVAEQFVE